jgi:hypothetical protein
MMINLVFLFDTKLLFFGLIDDDDDNSLFLKFKYKFK